MRFTTQFWLNIAERAATTPRFILHDRGILYPSHHARATHLRLPPCRMPILNRFRTTKSARSLCLKEQAPAHRSLNIDTSLRLFSLGEKKSPAKRARRQIRESAPHWLFDIGDHESPFTRPTTTKHGVPVPPLPAQTSEDEPEGHDSGKQNAKAFHNASGTATPTGVDFMICARQVKPGGS